MNLYQIPCEHSFLEDLADGLKARFEARLSEALIILPSIRAVAQFEEIMLAKNEASSLILPRLVALGNFGEEELFFETLDSGIGEAIPPKLSATAQRVLLARLVREHFEQDSNYSQVLALTVSLERLLAKFRLEEICLETLAPVVPDNLAEHWQKIASFLDILKVQWPALLAERGVVDSYQYRQLYLKQQINVWQQNPPEFPVILAGLAGANKTTRNLMYQIAKLKDGAVVLPGVAACPEDGNSTHPMINLHKLLAEFNVKEQLPYWHNSPKQSSIQLHIDNIFAKHLAAKEGECSLNWSQIIAETNLEEVALISLKILEARSQGRQVTVVTNDEFLKKHLEYYLARWNIRPANNDNNQPHLIPIMQLWCSLAKFLIEPDIVHFVSLFRNPIFAKQYGQQWLNEFRTLEYKNFRQPIGVSLFEYKKEINAGNLVDWLARLEEIVAPATRLTEEGKFNFADFYKLHYQIFCQLVDVDLLASLDGYAEHYQTFLTYQDALAQSGSKVGLIAVDDYLPVMQNFAECQRWQRGKAISSVNILSPMEARLLDFDLLIIAGLNEGCWPSDNEVSPWFNWQVAEELGLAGISQNLRRAAHDFYNLLFQPEIIFTRSKRSNGSLNIPSRFLVRVQNYLADNLPDITSKYKSYLLQLKQASVVEKTARPLPCPSLHIRPSVLSVTQIEQLITDPYRIYASKILRLKELNGLASGQLQLVFGSWLHKVIEIFISYHRHARKPEFELQLIAEKELDKLHLPVLTRFEWLAKASEILPAFYSYFASLVEDASDIYSEKMGKVNLVDGNSVFSLKGKADLIIKSKSGRVHIIDFKTGQPPSNKAVKMGISPQLTLLAMILLDGGFAELDPSKIAELELSYFKLDGEASDDSVTIIKGPEELIKEARTGLRNLLAYYRLPDAIYHHNPLGLKHYPDLYDHLARVEEYL